MKIYFGLHLSEVSDNVIYDHDFISIKRMRLPQFCQSILVKI